jgi:beta-glucosidase
MIEVRFALENTSSRAGAEVAQVYLGLPETTGEPPRRLAGWPAYTWRPTNARWSL